MKKGLGALSFLAWWVSFLAGFMILSILFEMESVFENGQDLFKIKQQSKKCQVN